MGSSRNRRLPCCDDKFSNFPCKLRCMVFTCILIAVAGATLLAVYFFVIRPNGSQKPKAQQGAHILILPENDWTPQCPEDMLPSQRFDCYPEATDVDREQCIARGCCWVEYLDDSFEDDDDSDYSLDDDKVASDPIPRCIYPSNYGYKASGKMAAIFDGFEVPLQRLPTPSRYGDDIQEARIRVEMQTPYRLRIKFYDAENSRYEVPVPKIPVEVTSPRNNGREMHLYSVTYNISRVPFAVQVRRSNSDTIIFDTSVGGLTLSHHFLQLSTLLPSANVYGLGEHVRGRFRHNMLWHTWSMFADPSTEGKGNLHGVHPLYLCMEKDGKAHGVLLLNSHAMEVQLQPTPALTFRTIGGVLDFYFFLGPTPEDVIQQYSEAVGRPVMPPYWSLGFHVGRHGFHSTKDIERFLDGLRTKNIPADALNLDVDIFQHSFSLDKEKFGNLLNLTTDIHSRGQKLLLALQPGVSISQHPRIDAAYNVGLQLGVFITDKWGFQPIVGKSYKEDIVFPDFGNPVTMSWWSDVLSRISADVDFDGLWMTNNEPASNVDGAINGCMDDDLNRPPYVPKIKGKTLYTRTLCMDALQLWKDNIYTHYHLHNLYGHSMVLATEHALRLADDKERTMLLSRSTYIGSGHYVGHWLEGIKGTWEDMAASIPAILEFSLFGIPFTGSNICGDIQQQQDNEDGEELCIRWIQLGSFYPFSRMHNSEAGKLCQSGKFSQDFFRAARRAIFQRYELLPYLYTLYYLAHIQGSTVMRPLLHEFPTDNNTYNINKQFMWGSALLISPVTEKSATSVTFYLPHGVWYDFYNGETVSSRGDWFDQLAPLYNYEQPMTLHLRAGHIIPLQQPANTTTISRKNPMMLLVALNSSLKAEGNLFWDDGKTRGSHVLGEYLLVSFTASEDTLIVAGHLGKKVFMSNFDTAFIQDVRIMGLQVPPHHVTIDDSYVLTKKQHHWDAKRKVLNLRHILIPLARTTEIKWINNGR